MVDSRVMEIEKAEPLAGRSMRLWFSDGFQRDVDVTPYLRGPVFEQVRDDADFFRQVQVEYGTVAWPNGADIDADVLRFDEVEPAWGEMSASSSVPAPTRLRRLLSVADDLVGGVATAGSRAASALVEGQRAVTHLRAGTAALLEQHLLRFEARVEHALTRAQQALQEAEKRSQARLDETRAAGATPRAQLGDAGRAAATARAQLGDAGRAAATARAQLGDAGRAAATARGKKQASSGSGKRKQVK